KGWAVGRGRRDTDRGRGPGGGECHLSGHGNSPPRAADGAGRAEGIVVESKKAYRSLVSPGVSAAALAGLRGTFLNSAHSKGRVWNWNSFTSVSGNPNSRSN